MADFQWSFYAKALQAKNPANKQLLSFNCGLLALSLLCSAVPAEAKYRVDVGDVIEIFVARVPELQRRVPVRPDGSISFPLTGTLSVAGLSPSALEVTIQGALAGKLFRQRAPDGRESDVLISHTEITATVVEYRPIYVNGDVSRPGAHAYRPLMTVRQAVAQSGGYDILRVRAINPHFEAADLRSEYQSLWVELAKEQAHVWRLKSELGDEDNLDQNVLTNVPAPRSTILQIVKLEAEHLTMRQADHQRQKAFLQFAIKQADEQIAVLSEGQQKEEQGVRADAEELQRVIELYGKGSLPSPRVTDARRAVLLSATRKLQTAAQLVQIKRQRNELSRQMEKHDDQRKIDLLRELQDASVRLTALRVKLQSIGEKIQYTAVRSELAREHETKAEIAIIRRGEKGRERFIADDDSELEPGDVVQVALRLDQPAGIPVQ